MYNVIYLDYYEASVFITGIVLLLNHKGSVREKLKTKHSDITNKSHLCKYENVVFIIKNPQNRNKCFQK